MIEKKTAWWFLRVAVLSFGLISAARAAQLDGPATIVYDQFRVPTIIAQSERDAIFLQGYLHAKNRLFQMDFQRRLFSGRVSELVGTSGLAQDVQLRTLGLRRAAERSWANPVDLTLVQTPESRAWLEAYADGVNAFLQDTSQPLPIEYGALEITRAGIPLWTPIDSLTMAKGLAFGLSFDLGDINRTLAVLNFRGACTALGTCNGLQLYNDDLWRVAPFESGFSIPSPPLLPPDPSEPTLPPDESFPPYLSDPSLQTLLESYRSQISEIPILNQALEKDTGEVGSNWWVVAGSNTDSGYPMLSNDPHLSLGAPATFYEVHLVVTGGINVTGVSFPGTPGVVIGCNQTICWGATVNPMDVTDVFNEVLLAQIPGQPTTPTAILFQGSPEPLVVVPQTFRANVIGNGTANDTVVVPPGGSIPPATLVVSRRNNGPIVQVSYNPSSPTPLTGLSVAYTGWSATHEMETLRRFARAASMQDFKDALQFFDVGSQNWSYADVNGNIAYYTSGELPLRQDLQTILFPAGLTHPGLIRDGTNTNPHQWLPGPSQPNQALSTAILPFSEMPQVENPPSGYVLNANNDPIGTTLDNSTWNQYRAGFNGVLYLSAGYASGERLGRIQRLFSGLLAGSDKLSVSESAAVQANNQLLDAEVLSPYLLAAYANATDPGAAPELQAIVTDPRIGDAITRLAGWDFSTPTGIQQGYDPFDDPLLLPPPSPAEINASVAATIYAVWRGQVVQRVIDGTLGALPLPPPGLTPYSPGSDQAMSALRRLLENYPINGGTGASLINFFRVPGVADAAVARDIILLESLRNGLNLLAGPVFAPAFANSTDLNDYRWGKLHRVVFSHYLGGPFNIPPTGSPANPLGPSLPGFPRAGGRGAVDASSHDARADGLNEFMFSSGPARRLIATMRPDCPEVLEVIPGGENGAPGSPNGTDQLAFWLVNAYKPLPVCLSDVYTNAVETLSLACGNGVVDPGEGCDDGNVANGDCCSSACVFEPVATSCEDGSACTTLDVCNGAGTCVGGPAPDCDDGNFCTDDSCDPGSGCVYLDNVLACDDGNACTLTDACSAGACVGRDPVVCNALDQCHEPGVCDPGTGICSDPNSPDGKPCDDDNTCTTSDACQAGVCYGPNTALLEPNPRTNGYYKRLCIGPHSGDQLTAADAACVAEVAPLTFGSVLTVADICAVLGPSQPNNGMCQQSEDDLMVLALNICKARVCDTQAIASQCGSNTTVGQSLAETDAIFSDPGRNFDTCQHGKCLDEEINTGRALEMNSLMLARAAGGGVTMSWQEPYTNDGQSVNTYKVWRRVVGNGAFIKIATVGGLTYTDSTPGDFEYEVTAVKH